MTTNDDRSYPRTVDLAGRAVELDLMTGDHAEKLAHWARELPKHDLLFLRRDITRQAEIDDWLQAIESGDVITILAAIDGGLVGYGTMHRSDLRWSHHVAELRVVVGLDQRGIGLGRLLTQEVFAVALGQGVEKMIAQMTLDQAGARRTFEGLGFKPEALLRDHVKDLSGETHDLLVMSHSVAEFDQALAAYGVAESLG